MLYDRVNEKIDAEELVIMAEFVFKSDYFEFNSKVKQYLSGTAIGTKFVPPYTYIFINQVETDPWATSVLKPFVWFRSFLFGLVVKKSLGYF